MAERTVEITYQHAGTTPPLYVAGSFTEPAWVPEELECHRTDEDGKDGDPIFHKTFRVKDGSYQYKFRVGDGDWWICDESKATSKSPLSPPGIDIRRPSEAHGGAT